jgi:hypothetical protein
LTILQQNESNHGGREMKRESYAGEAFGVKSTRARVNFTVLFFLKKEGATPDQPTRVISPFFTGSKKSRTSRKMAPVPTRRRRPGHFFEKKVAPQPQDPTLFSNNNHLYSSPQNFVRALYHIKETSWIVTTRAHTHLTHLDTRAFLAFIIDDKGIQVSR